VAITRLNRFLTGGTFPREFLESGQPGTTTENSPSGSDDGSAAFAVVLADSPRFTIVNASNRYLQLVRRSLRELLGCSMFRVFDQGHPSHRPTLDPLRTSFSRVITSGSADASPVVRYNLERPEAEGGGFEERYWRPRISPLHDARGHVRFIILQAEDVTATVLDGGASPNTQIPTLRASAE
jgi:PAS domain-containing protein